jgi:hypothetical protein
LVELRDGCRAGEAQLDLAAGLEAQ